MTISELRQVGTTLSNKAEDRPQPRGPRVGAGSWGQLSDSELVQISGLQGSGWESGKTHGLFGACHTVFVIDCFLSLGLIQSTNLSPP